MAVGLDLDTEGAYRASIPTGGAGTLSDGAFANCFTGVWLYRPSSTATYALTAGGSIIDYQAGARTVSLGFNSAGSVLADLNLQIVFNSAGGTGTPATFSGHAGNTYLDEWVYYFILENSTSGQIAGYIRLADLTTATTQTRANDNAGSQYVNTLTFGNNSSLNAVVLGHYAYARARYGTGITVDDAKVYAASAVPAVGDWGFWPLADNADTGDDSGNGYTLTFAGTLSSESDPNLPTHYSLVGTGTQLTLTGGNAAPQHSGILGTGNFFDAKFFNGQFFGVFAAGDPTLVGTGTPLTATGGTAALKVSRILVGTGTALAATGGNALLKVDRKLTATGTLLTATGADAGFNFVRGMSGTGTALAATGGTAALKVSRILVATGTALAATGGTAVPVVDRKLVATGTPLALTGGTALPRVDRILVATGTLLTLSGGNATLEKSGAGSKTLSGEGTALALAGGTALPRADRILVGTGSAGTLTGATAFLRVDRVLSGEAGILALFGGDATLETSGGSPAVPAATGPGPAGRSSRDKRRKVVIGDRVYEVDSLRDVEFLLKRVVREETPEVAKPVKARKRVVGKVKADAEPVVSVPVEIPAIAVDWTPLYQQLAMQDAAYAQILARVLEKQEEDDIETLLLIL